MQARIIGSDEMARYQQQGYMRYGPVLSADELADLRGYVDHLVANLPPGKRPEAMDMAHVGDDYLMRLCSSPGVLDVVEQFVGPDIVLFASHFICKPRGDGKAVPWHQDATYWPLNPMKVVTLWLAVDDATVDNGCMRVIPGTHKLGPLDHQTVKDIPANVLDQEFAGDQLRLDSAVDIVLKAGECSFHEPYLLHGSNPNHSDRRRCGYTMRYMPPTTGLERAPGFWENHPLYLVRGRDAGGVNHYANA